MSDRPGLSIVIPHRKGESIEDSLTHIRALSAGSRSVEVLTVCGNQPSVQRNACIRRSHAEFLYFLDNDSEPEPQNILRAMQLFEDSRVAVVGGPNLPRAGQQGIQRDFSAILASPLAVGPVADRYRSSGPVREATDRELILCNLFIRKSVLEELGAFREDLYPNEENEFMNRIQSADYKLMYDPEIKVHRSPRPDYFSFVRMLLGYGAGRFKQMAVDFRWHNLAFFIPALFALYILAAPLVWALFGAGIWTVEHMTLQQWLSAPVESASSWVFVLYNALLLMYGSILGFAASQTFVRLRPPRSVLSFFRLPLLFFSVHFFYGLGIWKGLLASIKKEKKVVEYEIQELQL